MPIDWQQILQLAPLALAKPGSPQAAAMMQGYQQAMLRRQQQQAQSQQMAGQDELRQAQMANLEADNQRAEAQLGMQQERLALDRLAAFGRQDQGMLGALAAAPENVLAPEATPLSAQNDLTVQRLTQQQAYGVPAGTPQPPLPNMTLAVSNRDKRQAQAVLDRIAKNPIYAGYQGTPELEELSVQFKGGQIKKVKELRAMAEGQLLGPDGLPAQPMPAARAGRTVTPGSFEEYIDAPPERQAVIEAGRKRYMQSDDRPLASQQPQAPGQLAPAVQRRVDAKAKGFDAQPAVKNTQKMAEAVQFATSLDINTKNPADDIGLLYAFAKAMDPDSVVREGEYATVQKYAQSWADSFRFNAQRIFSNTNFLSPQARQNMKSTIQKKYQAGKAQYDNVKKSYARQIDKITGQPGSGEEWLVDYGGAFPADTPPADTTEPADEALRILEERRKAR